MWGLSHLESCGAPVHKVDRFLRLNRGYRSVDIFWNYVSSIQKADSHVLSFCWIAFDHLVARLEACLGNRVDAHGVVVRHLRGDERGISYKREVNSRIRHLSVKLN